MAALLDFKVVSEHYSALHHADSHGSAGRSLGTGSLYYAFCHALQAQVAVCIGSSAGFVPGLIRQAQLDLNLDPSVTYLVDANIPDLGFGGPSLPGGWMTPNNDFLVRADAPLLLPVLSKDAAMLFARSKLRIDYLHIDGDHSKSGAYADLAAYAPITAENAVISVHDFGLASVREAVEMFLEEFPAWTRLDLEEIGAGCAFLRRAAGDRSRKRTRRDTLPDLRTTIADASENDVSLAEKAKFERWPYLTSEGFRLRYSLAASFVDMPDVRVVEVGGFPNSISAFLNSSSEVYAIEPYLPESHRVQCESDMAARGGSITFFPGTPGSCGLDPQSLGRFNLVALGFDLSEGIASVEDAAKDLSTFAALVAAARIAVIEFPDYEPSRIAWDAIQAAVNPNCLHEVVLDLRNDPSARESMVTDGRAVRRLRVISGVSPVDEALRNEFFADAAKQLMARRPGTQPIAEPDYEIGSEIVFGRGTNCINFLRHGWSYPENNLVWSHGSTSRMEMRVRGMHESIPAKGYKLRIRMWPACEATRHPSQRLVIWINDVQLLDARFGAGRHCVEVPVPEGLLVPDVDLKVRFEHEDSIAPASLWPGTSQDLRQLAFAFESLCILPVPDDARC